MKISDRLENFITVIKNDEVRIYDDELDILEEALETLKIFENLKKPLLAIAEGSTTHGSNDRYVIVENPESVFDNTEDPNLVIDTWATFGMIPDEEKEYIANADFLFNKS